MSDPVDQRQVLKQAFFDHLKREGTPKAHLATYGDYLDFLLAQLGPGDLMDLAPEVLYERALPALEKLDGDDVVETYLRLLEQFLEFWTERWEKMHAG